MGKTLCELKETMSMSEYRLWLEYNKESPIGDVRNDYQAASIVSAVISSQGGKLSIEDARLKWGVVEDEEETPQEYNVTTHPLAAFLHTLI
ncbi:phage tail assembly protein T [Klebsiella variicola]|uniref:phage tail assembly protein T n=1 Tax=Klebsiella variicola TaxID=244366 RepID=UPI001F45C139|nr:DUF4035 domain-containing protein [Klebsiella variicola]